jgi:endonuclease/exonuclease/phosphatase family metal-dependent hydrolase
MLIRTWNLFHGNTKPPERHAFLAEMTRLAASDDPDAVCLQEVPVWALERLEGWSSMRCIGAVAQPPRFGPVAISAELGRVVTSLHNGLFRSAVSGQANAILLSREATVLEAQALTLNSRAFRMTQAMWLRLGLIARLAWAKERRVVQVLRASLPGDRAITIGNLHATSYPADQRLADAELLRAAVFVDAVACRGDVVVLAGDFNVPAARSATLTELTSETWGFSAPAATGIDHVLVRGAPVQPLVRWPRERRTVGGRTLSDHTPVDAVVA